LSRVPSFHSVNEWRKIPAARVYHNNDACQLGKQIPGWERKDGNGNHRLCKECDRLNANAPNRWV
jgi:hypothetical protein